MRDTQSHTEHSRVRVLVAASDASEVLRIHDMLANSQAPGFEIAIVEGLDRALQHLRSAPVDVLLLDLELWRAEGLSTSPRTEITTSGVPVLVMAGPDKEESALRALREGAQDYLVKGEFDGRQLVRTIRHAVERHRLVLDLTRARERELYFATHDRLTGLANRDALYSHLEQALSYAKRYDRRLGLMHVDLDRFKAINDTLGQSVGDRILQGIGERLAAAVRNVDLVARIGADEFAVVVANPQQDHDPAKVAMRLLQALACPFGLESTQYIITACIGIAIFPDDGEDPPELIQNAGLATYHAKKQGRGQYHFYSEELNAAARLRLDLERGLRRAIEEDQLFLEFQPQIDACRGHTIAAEALVRWRHPSRGIVPPAQFIPVAEESGLISQIGEWVLKAACTQGRRWTSREGVPLRIAVNVSARQLTDMSLPDRVETILCEAGLPTDRLELEITESTLMHEAAIAALRRLRRMGIRISIDDFGTGYSSLSTLKQMPVTALKIDRSFVQDVTTNPAGAKITAAAVALGRELGLETVAEGVETPEQLEFLRSCGCDLMQGFLFSRPIPKAELEAWLKNPNIPKR